MNAVPHPFALHANGWENIGTVPILSRLFAKGWDTKNAVLAF